MKKRIVKLGMALMLVFGLTLALAGCQSQAPIVGTWQNTSSGNEMEFKADGTFSYTNSTFTELGDLTGTWEELESSPVEAGGKTWSLYIYITGRTVTGDGESGNVHFLAVSGNEMYGTGGARNLDSFLETGEPSEFMLKYLAYERA